MRTNNMKIAHIVCTYPPYYGGMGNVVFQTVSELAKRGHETVVFTPQYVTEDEIKDIDATPERTHDEHIQTNIDFAKRLTPTLRYGNAARMPALARELDAFDMVHLHYPFFGTANVVRKWKLRNPHKPFVLTYHMDTRSSGWKGLVFAMYSRFWMPKIINAADVCIVSSFDYLEASDAALLYKKNPKKWVELPFGVDTNRFAPRVPEDALYNSLGLDPALPTILFVGGMDKAHYFKGIPKLLDALVMLKGTNAWPVQAVCVGKGSLRREFELRAKGMGLEKYVRFTGGVSDEQLPLFFNLADVLVLPSTTKGEAFGMVLLEAMASGVPVIASDLPGVRSVATQGGVTVEPGNAADLADAIMGFFVNSTMQQHWKERVRSVAEERYAWGPIVDGLEEVYGKVVGSK